MCAHMTMCTCATTSELQACSSQDAHRNEHMYVTYQTLRCHWLKNRQNNSKLKSPNSWYPPHSGIINTWIQLDIAAGPLKLQVLFGAHIVHVETTEVWEKGCLKTQNAPECTTEHWNPPLARLADHWCLAKPNVLPYATDLTGFVAISSNGWLYNSHGKTGSL